MCNDCLQAWTWKNTTLVVLYFFLKTQPQLATTAKCNCAQPCSSNWFLVSTPGLCCQRFYFCGLGWSLPVSTFPENPGWPSWIPHPRSEIAQPSLAWSTMRAGEDGPNSPREPNTGCWDAHTGVFRRQRGICTRKCSLVHFQCGWVTYREATYSHVAEASGRGTECISLWVPIFSTFCPCLSGLATLKLFW